MSQTITRDITTHFIHFVPINYKIVHESFIIKNNISWWNINFERSYVIIYKKQNSKEKFNMLEHSKHEKYFNFFKCKCLDTCEFYPHLWQYDKHYNDNHCPFRQRCDYFKTLQSIDKNLPDNEKLAHTGTIQYKDEVKLLHDFKTYVFRKGKRKVKKNNNNVQEFTNKKLEIAITNQIKQIEEYKLKSLEYYLVSSSAQSLFDRADF
ncbi:4285_t:CDS:2 [Dentiscutata erythropus]|uniref:4285_t:CDS:1 n=1 Tax=Dentiscutata erythropus TaxID=1348616 RepID=A0A9N9AIB7_9GLOM|nr:4285_t:CDS:2 [Dentiscutata erythropus]